MKTWRDQRFDLLDCGKKILIDWVGSFSGKERSNKELEEHKQDRLLIGAWLLAVWFEYKLTMESCMCEGNSVRPLTPENDQDDQDDQEERDERWSWDLSQHNF